MIANRTAWLLAAGMATMVSLPAQAALVVHYDYEAANVSGTLVNDMGTTPAQNATMLSTATAVTTPVSGNGSLYDEWAQEANSQGVLSTGATGYTRWYSGTKITLTDFTVAGWFKVPTTTTGTWTFAGTGKASGTVGWLFLKGSDGKLKFLTGTGGSRTDAITMDAFVNDGLFHHLAAVVDRTNGSATIYLDGTALAMSSAAVDKNFTASSNAFHVGATVETTPALSLKDGLVDDFRIYDEKLTAEQIHDLIYIPEPASMSLLALGSAFFVVRRRQS